MRGLSVLLLFIGTLTLRCEAHGAVVHPPPRNAIDGQIYPWNSTVPHPVPFGGKPDAPQWCPIGDASLTRGLSGANGQACFWFSNGCSIGCPECDGITRGPIPVRGSHGCKGMKPLFPDDPSAEDNCARKMDVCGLGYEATNCDPATRTYNLNATCGADDDYYYYSPWRAPGSAPLFDSCGVAGGRPPPAGGYGAQYKNTTFAKQGDLGSRVLDPRPTGVLWRAGDVVEVSWAVEANHGGGYLYRLCKLDDPRGLTEACFDQHPLEFVGSQMFRWGGKHGKTFNFTGTYVSQGTKPHGSKWAMNPIPDFGSDPDRGPHPAVSFQPRCPESEACLKGDHGSAMDNPCQCSGEWGPYDLEIVDRVQLPSNLAAGEWVLGWRWDCEESNQVWTSCSDVSVVM